MSGEFDHIYKQLSIYEMSIYRGNPTAQRYVQDVLILLSALKALRRDEREAIDEVNRLRERCEDLERELDVAKKHGPIGRMVSEFAEVWSRDLERSSMSVRLDNLLMNARNIVYVIRSGKWL